MSGRPPKEGRKKVNRSTGLEMLINSTPIADTRRRRHNKRIDSSSTSMTPPITATSSIGLATASSVYIADGTPDSGLRPVRLAATESPYYCQERNSPAATEDDDEELDAEEELQQFLEDEQNEEEENDAVFAGDSDNEDDEPTIDPVTGKRKKKYKPAMTPDNVLLPWQQLKDSYSRFGCPKCQRKTLVADAYSKGSISDLVITCQRPQCQETLIIQTPNLLKRSNNAAGDGGPVEGNNMDQELTPEHPKWTAQRQYGINHGLVLMIQLLGIGSDGLGIIFAFLGIASASRNYDKWKHLQDMIGVAEEAVCDEVLKENMKEELDVLRAKAKKDFNEWYFDGDHGSNASEQEKVNKMRDLLHINPEGRIGIPVQCDEGWQRRAIGFSGGMSKSGHNLAVGCNTLKILNKVVYSMQCTTCQWYKKRQRQVPQHRCSHNFSNNHSSKSMEAKATVQHKLDIDGGTTGAYIHTLLTDDDSTVRANILHSYHAVADRDYPGWNDGGGVGKGGTDWPYELRTNTKGGLYKHYYKDYGKLPLHLTAVSSFISDIGHRVKCIAKMIFLYKYKSKKPEERGEIGLHKWECLKLKKQAGYYFKQAENQDLPYELFCQRSHCIYLHHFNDHSCCNEAWCKVLKSKRRHNPITLTETYRKRFRDKEKDKELFLLLKNKGYASYLTADMLRQVYHKFSTNKNESLNRRITSVAPKDRYFSGTMSLSDRISNVAITDSIGYLQGLQRILKKVDPRLELPPVLLEWCRRKDKKCKSISIHWKRPEVKKRRMEAINAAINAGRLSEERSKREGFDYGSGVALDSTIYCDNDSNAEAIAEESEAGRVLAVASTGIDQNDNELQIL